MRSNKTGKSIQSLLGNKKSNWKGVKKEFNTKKNRALIKKSIFLFKLNVSNKFVETIGDKTPPRSMNIQHLRAKVNPVATDGNGIALTLPKKKIRGQQKNIIV